MGMLDKRPDQLMTDLEAETAVSERDALSLAEATASSVRVKGFEVEATRTPENDVLLSINQGGNRVASFEAYTLSQAREGKPPLASGRCRVIISWSDEMDAMLPEPDSEGWSVMSYAKYAKGVKGFSAYKAYLDTYGASLLQRDPSASVVIASGSKRG